MLLAIAGAQRRCGECTSENQTADNETTLPTQKKPPTRPVLLAIASVIVVAGATAYCPFLIHKLNEIGNIASGQKIFTAKFGWLMTASGVLAFVAFAAGWGFRPLRVASWATVCLLGMSCLTWVLSIFVDYLLIICLAFYGAAWLRLTTEALSRPAAIDSPQADNCSRSAIAISSLATASLMILWPLVGKSMAIGHAMAMDH